jgi:hypothetical protein
VAQAHCQAERDVAPGVLEYVAPGALEYAALTDVRWTAR